MHLSIPERALTGFSGAAAVTLVHETMRKRIPNAPRMDLVGQRGLSRLLRTIGAPVPRGRRLHRSTLLGDLLANSAWYALVGRARRPLLRGAVLGGLAGVGGVVLTPLLGLGRRPVRRTPETALMTTAWYLLGGLAAGATERALQRRRHALP